MVDYYVFLVTDVAADLHLLGMDFLLGYGVHLDLQAGQLETARHSF